MDKALESVLGYVNVLPGAFSSESLPVPSLPLCAHLSALAVYRWVAIRGEPLAAYFTLEETAARDLKPFALNMYLAEDRVLGFEIVGACGRSGVGERSRNPSLTPRS